MIRVLVIFFLLLCCYLLGACRQIEAQPAAFVPPKLSWDMKLGKWSNFTAGEIEKSMPSLSKAKDMASFCPKYDGLSPKAKVWVWAELISAMAKFESGWEPTSRMIEPSSSFPKKDPITGQPVASEGLLQLSYQDKLWMKSCRFDWSKDKALAPRDPKKTILQPEINIECGVKILARQIERRGLIVVPSGPYWSVIYDGKYSKLPQIRAMVKASPLCH